MSRRNTKIMKFFIGPVLWNSCDKTMAFQDACINPVRFRSGSD